MTPLAQMLAELGVDTSVPPPSRPRTRRREAPSATYDRLAATAPDDATRRAAQAFADVWRAREPSASRRHPVRESDVVRVVAAALWPDGAPDDATVVAVGWARGAWLRGCGDITDPWAAAAVTRVSAAVGVRRILAEPDEPNYEFEP
ncbi:MAG TPA: hypothetical protein VD995_24150 [Azospirillum sp.]|nr:hypothetical protein [Azospirillum sp.]